MLQHDAKIHTNCDPQAPSCSDFNVQTRNWNPHEKVNYGHFTIAENRIADWPMVYILSNDREAYVGQTTSVLRRMDQHAANPEKQGFDRISLIHCEAFNASVITDYEHRLIQLMSADGMLKLTNKNMGMEDSNYFSKSEYSKMFESLWEELKHEHLVEHTIQQIEDSEVFRYSPYKSLNHDQQDALVRIMQAISDLNGHREPIVVEGMPGTGKTVLAIFLLKALKDIPAFANLNIRILEPIGSLRSTMQTALKGVSGINRRDIMGPADLVKPEFGFVQGKKDNYDILLVDEAHRLKGRRNIQAYKSHDSITRTLGLPKNQTTQLDWVLDQARLPIFFYDPLQTIGRASITSSEMENGIGHFAETPIRLESQMRVKGGKHYLDYIDDILHDRTPCFQQFDHYDFVMHESFEGFVDSFEHNLSEHDLTRMCAGFAWKWATNPRKVTGTFDIEIEGIKLCWNRTKENWVGLGLDDPAVAREVGCIHSVQGYDLSTAYVIIGNDLRYDDKLGRLTVSKPDYFDTNGKNKTDDDQLLEFIRNIYYVLMTRGMMGTHLYVCEPALRRHLRRFVRCVERDGDEGA